MPSAASNAEKRSAPYLAKRADANRLLRRLRNGDAPPTAAHPTPRAAEQYGLFEDDAARRTG